MIDLDMIEQKLSEEIGQEPSVDIKGYWYDSYGRLRPIISYKLEQVYELELPDEAHDD